MIQEFTAYFSSSPVGNIAPALGMAQILQPFSRKAFEAALFQMFLNAVLTLTLNGPP